MKKYILGLSFLQVLLSYPSNAADKGWLSYTGASQAVSLVRTYALDDQAIRGACVYAAMFYAADPAGDYVDRGRAYLTGMRFNDDTFHGDDFAMMSSVAPALAVAETLIRYKNQLLVPIINNFWEFGASTLESLAKQMRAQKINKK